LEAGFVNSFIKAVNEVFPVVTGKEIKRGKPYVKESPFAADVVAVMVSVTGEIESQVIYSFKNGYLLKVASTMCGMELQELDELTTSAVAELCNMISGRAVMNLDEVAGKKAVISPPVVLVGESMKVFVKPPILCVPFESVECGGFELNCALA
jgi:chemotaxis protein CheX